MVIFFGVISTWATSISQKSKDNGEDRLEPTQSDRRRNLGPMLFGPYAPSYSHHMRPPLVGCHVRFLLFAHNFIADPYSYTRASHCQRTRNGRYLTAGDVDTLGLSGF